MNSSGLGSSDEDEQPQSDHEDAVKAVSKAREQVFSKFLLLGC